MATYEIRSPAYLRTDPNAECNYIGAGASPSNPTVIEIPDDVEPSSTWVPVDEKAQKNIAQLGETRFKNHQAAVVFAPKKEEQDAASVQARFRAQHNKPIPAAAPAPARVVREINTNTELNEQKAKVVGRPSDRKPT